MLQKKSNLPKILGWMIFLLFIQRTWIQDSCDFCVFKECCGNIKCIFEIKVCLLDVVI